MNEESDKFQVKDCTYMRCCNCNYELHGDAVVYQSTNPNIIKPYCGSCIYQLGARTNELLKIHVTEILGGDDGE